jgi:integrase
VLVLNSGETKNSEPRIFPLASVPEITSILIEQEEATKKVEHKHRIKVEWLFHDPDGNALCRYYEKRDYWKPTRYFDRHWRGARIAAGLGNRRIHDFRRSGIRRFSARGVDDAIGMLLSGHKSMRVYHDYRAIGNEDLFEELKKLSDSATTATGTQNVHT